MKEKTRVPKFRTEAEEAKWWSDHREETAEWMKRAAAEGRTTNLAAIRKKRRESGSTPSVSIRIDPADLSRARVLAERRGLRYQTYLKMLLHEALEKEGRRLGG
jgi:predicted DNA binding CopG/RHH family protein